MGLRKCGLSEAVLYKDSQEWLKEMALSFTFCLKQWVFKPYSTEPAKEAAAKDERVRV